MSTVETISFPYENNSLVKPLSDYHGYLSGKLVTQLPEEGWLQDLALKVLLVATAPFAYLILSLSAAVGITLDQWIFEAELAPSPLPLMKNKELSLLQNEYFSTLDETLNRVLPKNSREIHATLQTSESDEPEEINLRLNNEFTIENALPMLRYLVNDHLMELESSSFNGPVSSTIKWSILAKDDEGNDHAFFLSTPIRLSIDELSIDQTIETQLMDREQLTPFQNEYFDALDSFIEKRVPDVPRKCRILLDSAPLSLEKTISFDHNEGKNELRAKLRLLTIDQLIELEERGETADLHLNLFIRNDEQVLSFLHHNYPGEFSNGKWTSKVIRNAFHKGSTATEYAQFYLEEVGRIYNGWDQETSGL